MKNNALPKPSQSERGEWTTIQLGEIAELRGRIGWKGLTAKEYTKEGPRFLSVHSLNYGDYVDYRDAFHISQDRYEESPEIMLQKDDILICKDGAGIGKLGIVPAVLEPTTINSSLLLIRPGTQVLPKYLYYCLLSPYFQNIVQSRLEGATTPHLYQRDIMQLPVHLAPLREQKRIVAVLDQAFAALDRARAHAEANLADAQELFASELDAVLARGSSNWARRPLRSLGTIQTGSTPKTAEPGNFGEDVPFITPGDFRTDGSLDTGNRGLSKQGASKVRLIPGGSALMVCIGATIGKAGFTSVEVAANQQINAITPNDDVSGEFLYYQFITPRFQEELMRRAGQATLPIVSKAKWSEIAVQVPPSLSIQLQVAAHMRDMRGHTERLQTSYRAKLTDLAILRQSLLQKAFAGEL